MATATSTLTARTIMKLSRTTNRWYSRPIGGASFSGPQSGVSNLTSDRGLVRLCAIQSQASIRIEIRYSRGDRKHWGNEYILPSGSRFDCARTVLRDPDRFRERAEPADCRSEFACRCEYGSGPELLS